MIQLIKASYLRSNEPTNGIISQGNPRRGARGVLIAYILKIISKRLVLKESCTGSWAAMKLPAVLTASKYTEDA